ncbi:MAG: hypothetical protein AseanaTS_02350 [Candidatus Pelagadaptatus aseana]|uniref:glycosyltransferase family 9 protein n=1 Tax=Candidatus Pelagadaptatus aseana TaxID=3120508 RepID=UPI0039B23C50
MPPAFTSLSNWFSDLDIANTDLDLYSKEILEKYDLIVCDPQDKRNTIRQILKDEPQLSKKTLWISCTSLPQEYEAHTSQPDIKPVNFNLHIQANRPLRCKVEKGPSLVQFAHQYCRNFFNIESAKFIPELTPPDNLQHRKHKNRILIFPTTNRDKKNYSTEGFNKLAKKLAKLGHHIEIAVTPEEADEFKLLYPEFNVIFFENLEGMFSYIYESGFVISNDSGSGHVASLLGISTVTIYKKYDEFEWRPGWKESFIARPRIRLKVAGKRIWKPFISHAKIIDHIKRNIHAEQETSIV